MSRARALDWLHPTHVDPVRSVPHSPADEACLRDGLLVEVWPGVLRARDLTPGPGERVDAVRAYVPRGGVLARQSAVWVHTGSARPERLDVVLAGTRHRSTGMVRVHAERLAEHDLVHIDGAPVTAPARTAVDVARWCPPHDVAAWVGALALSGLTAAEVTVALESANGLPGVSRARELLARVLPLPLNR